MKKGELDMVHIIELFESKIIFFNALEDLIDYARKSFSKSCVITDQNVYETQKKLFESLQPLCLIVVEPGEKSKDFSKIEVIYQTLLENNVDRSCTLIGIGGGVICDITGFVGSTYFRGLNFAFIPTTLLAMVDAAIGGKNGINIGFYKNVVGTIVQPRNVLLCLDLLETLPIDELRNGIAEIVKHGVIGHSKIIETLERSPVVNSKSLSLDLLKEVIDVKVTIVRLDQQDLGIRKLLNFGHTVGHGIELLKSLKHGFAVSIGMITELMINANLFGTSQTLTERLRNLLERLHLPTNICLSEEEINQLLKVISHDKKSHADDIDIVKINEFGKSEVVRVNKKQFQEALLCALKALSGNCVRA